MNRREDRRERRRERREDAVEVSRSEFRKEIWGLYKQSDGDREKFESLAKDHLEKKYGSIIATILIGIAIRLFVYWLSEHIIDWLTVPPSDEPAMPLGMAGDNDEIVVVA